MAEDRYRLILMGYGQEDKGEYYIEKDLAELLKIKPEAARKLLLSAPVKLEEDLSLEQATHHKEVIEKTGALCEVEMMKFDFSGLSLEPLE